MFLDCTRFHQVRASTQWNAWWQVVEIAQANGVKKTAPSCNKSNTPFFYFFLGIWIHINRIPTTFLGASCTSDSSRCTVIIPIFWLCLKFEPNIRCKNCSYEENRPESSFSRLIQLQLNHRMTPVDLICKTDQYY